ncbi:24501_t:CDS:2, partial [Dentiscutata erythropus]
VLTVSSLGVVNMASLELLFGDLVADILSGVSDFVVEYRRFWCLVGFGVAF